MQLQCVANGKMVVVLWCHCRCRCLYCLYVYNFTLRCCCWWIHKLPISTNCDTVTCIFKFGPHWRFSFCCSFSLYFKPFHLCSIISCGLLNHIKNQTIPKSTNSEPSNDWVDSIDFLNSASQATKFEWTELWLDLPRDKKRAVIFLLSKCTVKILQWHLFTPYNDALKSNTRFSTGQIEFRAFKLRSTFRYPNSTASIQCSLYLHTKCQTNLYFDFSCWLMRGWYEW